MQAFSKKSVITTIIIFVVIVVGILVTIFVLKKGPVPGPVQEQVSSPKYEVIGTSVQGRKIESYTYAGAAVGGNGDGAPSSGKNLLFVGGIHGGYEWNSVLLAYQFMDYLKANPSTIPAGVTVTIIPNVNPDAVFKVVGKEGRFSATDVSKDQDILASARFNAHAVDLNRNFDCAWQATATWQNKTVSAGSAPFSEPEAKALQQFILKSKPSAAIFWHSQANTVYAGDCKGVFLPTTLAITDAYAKASRYASAKTFTGYPVTGASDGWLTTIGIPAITVELKTHETIEWEQNLAGVKALFAYFADL